MSMSKLPTELDSKIASFLIGDTQTLSAFCKVSRYYRTIATPCLYKELEFHDFENIAIKQLLITLVHREELALHIASFTLDWTDSSEAPTRDTAIDRKMWEAVTALYKNLNQAVLPSPHPNTGLILARQLFIQLFSEEVFDAVVALILMLATNIEKVDICDPGDLVRDALGHTWRSTGIHPFHKLKSLTVSGYGGSALSRQVLLPSMNTFRIKDCRYCVLYHVSDPFICPAPKPSIPILHTVTFNHVELTLEFFQQFISSPWLVNLKALHLQFCGWLLRRENDPKEWDMSPLLRAMAKHIPCLEVLEWRMSQNVPNAKPTTLGTFKDLECLRELHVDSHLLVRVADRDLDALCNPQALIPKSLRHLRVHDVAVETVDHVVDKFHQQVDDGEIEEGAVLAQALNSLAVKLPLQSLRVDLNMEDYPLYDPYNLTFHGLDPPKIVFLRHAADELSKIGLTLEVHRMPPWDEGSKPLIKPGWTAPLADFQEIQEWNYSFF